MRPFALVLAAAAVLVPAREALACSCMEPWYTTLLAPADGATDVPTNTRIWIGGSQLALDYRSGEPVPTKTARLVDGHDTDVAVRASTIRSDFDYIAVLTPEAPLAAGATYRVFAGEDLLSSFTVGSAADTEAPPVPDVVAIDEVNDDPYLYESSCGVSYGVRVTAKSTGLLTLADRDRTATLDPNAIAGSFSSLAYESPEGAHLWLGRGGCSATWLEAEPGADASVRVGAFDLAGNFSGYSAAVEGSVPACGCGTTAGPGGALALALAALLRRRRG